MPARQHVAAAAAVSANSSTAARPLLVCLRGQTQRSSALGKLFCSTSLSSGSSGLGKLFCSTTFVGLHARANRAAAYLSSISSLLDTNRNSIRSTSLRQQRSWQAPLQHDLCWSACAGKPEQQPTQQYKQSNGLLTNPFWFRGLNTVVHHCILPLSH